VRATRVSPPLLVVLALLPAVRGEGVPLYAARERLDCQTCHVDPNGGGIRTEFGFAYGRNRHSVTPEEGKPWSDLTLRNRVGDELPLYVGLNLREMLLATTSVNDDSLDRAAFFQMESAVHLSFQPHERLSANVTVNGFDGGASVSDAYGLLRVGPWDAYLKLGRFRNAFGLRMDDHTVATRNGFLDFSGGTPGFGDPTYLPYDPRRSDQGIEVGVAPGRFFGRASLTNGASSPFFGSTRAQDKAIELGARAGPWQGAVSLWDDYSSDLFAFAYRRATRWSTYGMLGFAPFAVLGEIGAGTDELPAGERRNVLAGFLEANYSPAPPYNVRVRYDEARTDRALPHTGHRRWALEGEWAPVPFAELRLVYRAIAHESPSLSDERQLYLQGHFTY